MGSTRELIARNLETWNAHDREGWARDFSPEAELTGPGGLSGSGPAMAAQFYDIWHNGFPENEITPQAIIEDRESGVLEAIFKGTHHGPLEAPAGAIEATGKAVSIPFVVVHRVADGKFLSFAIYFDQLGMLDQLGLAPGAARA